jgi:hypothetical protein
MPTAMPKRKMTKPFAWATFGLLCSNAIALIAILIVPLVSEEGRARWLADVAYRAMMRSPAIKQCHDGLDTRQICAVGAAYGLQSLFACVIIALFSALNLTCNDYRSWRDVAVRFWMLTLAFAAGIVGPMRAPDHPIATALGYTLMLIMGTSVEMLIFIAWLWKKGGGETTANQS